MSAYWWCSPPPHGGCCASQVSPDGFASSNGRIEATEVDIASKIAGRIDTILVKEGQFVHQGEVLARMDTRVLNEQRLEAAAQIKEAESAVLAARALLDQRQSEMRASEAVVKAAPGGAGFHGETPCSLQHPLPAWRRLCPAAG